MEASMLTASGLWRLVGQGLWWDSHSWGSSFDEQGDVKPRAEKRGLSSLDATVSGCAVPSTSTTLLAFQDLRTVITRMYCPYASCLLLCLG